MSYLARDWLAGGVEACGDAARDEVLPHRADDEGDTFFVLGEVPKKAKCLFLDLRIYVVDESALGIDPSQEETCTRGAKVTYSAR